MSSHTVLLEKVTAKQYPVVFRFIGSRLVVSVPDLQITIAKESEHLTTAQEIGKIYIQIIEMISVELTKKQALNKKFPTITPPKSAIQSSEQSSDPAHFLTISQAAKILGLSDSTIRRHASKGSIKSIKTSGGHRRFLLEEIQQYFNKPRSVSPNSTK